MQKTANEIKSEFELLASGHYQIHSFLYAQEFEQQAYENLIYPLMLVYPLGGSLSGTTYTRNYRVVIADRVLKSEGNELEVESDTQLIALDVLAYWMKLGQNERFSITSSNTITPFWEKWGDEVTGHFVDIGIEEFYDFNSCAIPLSSAIPSPTNPCKDARILINTVVYGNAPSDTNFNVVVKNQAGTLVGSLIGGEWIVNTGAGCLDSTYTITNSSGTTLYTGTIPSGGSLTQAISNSTLNVNNSANTLISSRSILAQGTSSYNVADSSAVLKDEDGNVLSTTPIKATETEDIVAPNGDVSVNSVAFDDVLSGGTLNIEVRKSTGNDLIGSKQGQYWRIGDSTITNSDSSYDVDVKATESLSLPDSQINVNGVDEGDVVSVKTIDVNLEDSVGDPVTPTSVGLVGNILTIEVPSGATPMDVDFSADKFTALVGENITFTDLSDQTPTHWSWRFNDGTTSIVQNPVKSFSTLGFKNVTLLAGKVGAGGVNIKNSYIEILGDADALAFFARVNAAGGSLTSTEEGAINALVTQMKADGIWNSMLAIYPMVGASAAACAQNLKSSSFTGSFTSGWTFASTGITGNATNAYFNTNLPVSANLTAQNTSYGFYNRTNASTGKQAIDISAETIGSWEMGCDFSGSYLGRAYSGGAQALVANGGNRNGFYNLNSNATTNLYRNGNTSVLSFATSLSLPTSNVYLGGDPLLGSTYASPNQYAFAFVGEYLTPTQALNFYNAVQAFQTTLSRQV
jgi:PKD repeat protein